MYYILQENCSKSRRFLGLRPRPRWGSLRHSPRPPIRKGFLLSAIAASPLRRLQFTQLLFMCKKTLTFLPAQSPPLGAYTAPRFSPPESPTLWNALEYNLAAG